MMVLEMRGRRNGMLVKMYGASLTCSGDLIGHGD